MTGSALTSVAAAACASGSILAYAVRSPRSSLLAPSVYRGVTDRPAIALTFDDGPSESTPELLEILQQHGAPATFFQCGANVRRLTEIAREVAARGHEIGNHTDTHPALYLKSPGFIYREVAAAEESIERITGQHAKYFRAPYGARWFGLRSAQARLGLMGVMWTTLAMDWKLPSHRVIQRLLSGPSNGAILCLHDGRELAKNPNIGVTLEALRDVLPKLINSGFHFERLTEILCPTKN